MIVEITNTDYYFMLENQVRQSMKKFEVETCLPAAEKVLQKSNISINKLKSYPIEGYYHETDGLKFYFTMLRNLQTNESIYELIVDSEELEFLKKICDNDLFGVDDPAKRNPDALLKRRYDILTLTMESGEIFPDQKENNHPWNIERIVKGLGKFYNNRTNLVELAYLVNNPICLCCGAETNSAYRMFACASGSYSMRASYDPITYVWKVDPQVEELGKRITDEYNKLFAKDLIVAPNIENHTSLSKSVKVPRVALLGYVIETNEYYHWILNDFCQLTDVYSWEIITTETYDKGTKSGFTGNIFNAKPSV